MSLASSKNLSPTFSSRSSSVINLSAASEDEETIVSSFFSSWASSWSSAIVSSFFSSWASSASIISSGISSWASSASFITSSSGISSWASSSSSLLISTELFISSFEGTLSTISASTILSVDSVVILLIWWLLIMSTIALTTLSDFDNISVATIPSFISSAFFIAISISLSDMS